MQLTENERAALVDKAELADRIAALITLRTQWSPIDRALEIIDTVLADHAVPEPDADAVERAAKAIQHLWSYGEPKDGYQFSAEENARAALAAVPTVQAAAGDDLDADMTLAYMKGWQDGQGAVGDAPGLDELLDSLHPTSYVASMYRGSTAGRCYVEIGIPDRTGDDMPRDRRVTGTGPTRIAAIADAVARARRETTDARPESEAE